MTDLDESPTPPSSRWWTSRLWLLPILLLALFLRLGDFDEPWTQNGWQHMGATFAKMARNYVEHGYTETNLAPATNGVPPSDGKWDLFLHHPILFPIMISGSFHLFGVHEWSARLIPILGSLIEILALYAIARRLFDPEVALASAALAATTPAAAFYGSHVCELGPVVVGFSCLGFALFLRHRVQPSHWTFVSMLASLLIAAANDWPGIYMMGMIALVMLWERRFRQVAVVGSLIAVLLLGHLVLIKIATGELGGGRGGSMVHSFVQRSILGGLEKVGGIAYGLNAIREHLVSLYTVPVLALATAGVLFFHKSKSLLALIAFAIAGLAHMIIFTEGAARHDFWNVTMAPILLLSAGVGTVCGLRRLVPAPWHRRAAVVLILLTMAAGTWRTQQLFDRIESDYHHCLGTLIERETSPEDVVLTCEFEADPLDYYARRMIRGRVRDEVIPKAGLPPTLPFTVFVIPEKQYRSRPHNHGRWLTLLQEGGYPHDTFETGPCGRVWIFHVARR